MGEILGFSQSEVNGGLGMRILGSRCAPFSMMMAGRWTELDRKHGLIESRRACSGGLEKRTEA